jgi:hypothetical protein
MAHFPSFPRSIPKISSPPPPCPHPCWLLCHLCCCATTSSQSLDALPPPHNAPPPVNPFSSWLPLVCRLVVMSHLIVLPPGIIFCCAVASHVHPLPPAFICTGWLLHCILSCCLCLLSSCHHPHLSTRCHLMSPVHLLFALTGFHVASCRTSASHPLARPPLRLHLLLHLILVCPG